MEMFWNSIVLTVVQHFECTKRYSVVHFWVLFYVACEFHFNKKNDKMQKRKMTVLSVSLPMYVYMSLSMYAYMSLYIWKMVKIIYLSFNINLKWYNLFFGRYYQNFCQYRSPCIYICLFLFFFFFCPEKGLWLKSSSWEQTGKLNRQSRREYGPGAWERRPRP